MQVSMSAEASINVAAEPKEMLSVVRGTNGRYAVRINYSSLSVIQSCKRKALYVLERKLTAKTESAPTLFGRAIHKALEVWYSAPRASRRASTSQCDDVQAVMLGGGTPDAHGQCVRCAAIHAFLTAAEPLSALDSSDKRSRDNGLTILNAYFDHYAGDTLVVAQDALGPIVERRIEMPLLTTARADVTFFGTIDAILRDETTGTLMVVDHKTTSQLGSDFYNRVRPNFQYTGYVMAVQRALGLAIDVFMSNGIQVAKTKTAFARQTTRITAEDFEEFVHAVDWAVEDYIDCAESKRWPMSTPDPCTLWGGCGYRAICEVPAVLRENVIEALYSVKPTEASNATQ